MYSFYSGLSYYEKVPSIKPFFVYANTSFITYTCSLIVPRSSRVHHMTKCAYVSIIICSVEYGVGYFWEFSGPHGEL